MLNEAQIECLELRPHVLVGYSCRIERESVPKVLPHQEGLAHAAPAVDGNELWLPTLAALVEQMQFSRASNQSRQGVHLAIVTQYVDKLHQFGEL